MIKYIQIVNVYFVAFSASQEHNLNNTPPKHVQDQNRTIAAETKNVHVIYDVMIVIQYYFMQTFLNAVITSRA